MKKEYAEYLLNRTIEDYNSIAEQFSSTRNYLSNDIIALKSYAKDGDKILDVGCGNGRLTELFKDMKIKYTGVDNSNELIKIAKKRYPKSDFRLTNPLKFDFPDNSFDKIFCLSVFHHIPSTEFRVEYLKEIRRVLKPKGLLVLTVWNMWKKKGMVWQILRNGFFHWNLDLSDTFYPFKSGDKTIRANRYIHCFKVEELEKLFLQAGFEIVGIDNMKRGDRGDNENVLFLGEK